MEEYCKGIFKIIKNNMKIFIVAWARPNFMKIAPIIKEIEKNWNIEYKLIHTWQHFDKNMSDAFFEDLWLPYPNINLNISWWTVSSQIWKIMVAFDEIIIKEKPDYILVVWDVNSTVACAVVAKQNWVKIIHVEAWLRSFDNTMPEEINRVLTDRISDLLFVTEQSWIDNLKNEWIIRWVHLVWNVMIDSLLNNLEKINNQETYKKYNLEKNSYGLITIHRPSNVDAREKLERILQFFNKISKKIKLIIPLHPRTRKNIENFDLMNKIINNANIIIIEPAWYIDFINLLKNSKFILSDSWWIQEESTYLWIACLTMRENTERPITCDIWTSTLVCNDFELIEEKIWEILSWKYKKGSIPEFWDGNSARRILEVII